MTTLYLTRHGETIWNIEKRLQGWGNSPLTDLGKKQAESLRDRLKDMKIDVIYSSPIERAYSTATIVKGEKNIELLTHDGLKEVNFGSWEGMTLDEIGENNQYKDQLYNLFNNPKKYTPFDGEKLNDVKERCHNAIKEILEKNKGKNILVVTHGMTLKLLMLLFQEINEEEEFSKNVMGQATLTEIEVSDNGTYKVILKDDRSHYKEDFIIKGW